jgi:hypothetical protein
MYILIFWCAVRIMGTNALIPATAEFSNAAACTGGLFAIQDQGFTGICVPKAVK